MMNVSETIQHAIHALESYSHANAKSIQRQLKSVLTDVVILELQDSLNVNSLDAKYVNYNLRHSSRTPIMNELGYTFDERSGYWLNGDTRASWEYIVKMSDIEFNKWLGIVMIVTA